MNNFCFVLFSGLSTLDGGNKDYRVREILQFRSENMKAISLYTLEGGRRKKNDCFNSL